MRSSYLAATYRFHATPDWFTNFNLAGAGATSYDELRNYYLNEKNLDLQDLSRWPTWQGLALRLALYVLGFAVLWWGLSRLRRAWAARFGAGSSAALIHTALAVGLMAFLWYGDFGQLSQHPLFGMEGVFADGREPLEPLFGVFKVIGGRVSLGYYVDYFPLEWRLQFYGLLLGELVLLFLMAGRQRGEAWARVQSGRRVPPFLFPLLADIRGKIASDPVEAQALTERLAAFFRARLEVDAAPAVPLREALGRVEDELGLARLASPQAFPVDIELPEEVLEWPLRPLDLRNLVEGARSEIPGAFRLEALRIKGRWILRATGDEGLRELPLRGKEPRP